MTTSESDENKQLFKELQLARGTIKERDQTLNGLLFITKDFDNTAEFCAALEDLKFEVEPYHEDLLLVAKQVEETQTTL
jgi:K+/H+ antiporter YhaU regulatory subunit KhtT